MEVSTRRRNTCIKKRILTVRREYDGGAIKWIYTYMEANVFRVGVSDEVIANCCQLCCAFKGSILR